MISKLKLGRRDILLFLIGLVPLIIGFIYYSSLPEQVAIHFNLFNGEGNGFIMKELYLPLICFFTIGFPLLFKITRQIDPKRFNYIKFEDTFEMIRLLITVLLSVLFILTILYNIGFTITMERWGIPVLGVFLIFIGNITGRIRYNFFIGFRTPWTLANEDVWRRTHRFGGPIFIVSGILMLISLFFEKPLWIILFAFLVLIIIPTMYSYVISRKLR